MECVDEKAFKMSVVICGASAYEDYSIVMGQIMDKINEHRVSRVRNKKIDILCINKSFSASVWVEYLPQSTASPVVSFEDKYITICLGGLFELICENRHVDFSNLADTMIYGQKVSQWAKNHIKKSNDGLWALDLKVWSLMADGARSFVVCSEEKDRAKAADDLVHDVLYVYAVSLRGFLLSVGWKLPMFNTQNQFDKWLSDSFLGDMSFVDRFELFEKSVMGYITANHDPWMSMEFHKNIDYHKMMVEVLLPHAVKCLQSCEASELFWSSTPYYDARDSEKTIHDYIIWALPVIDQLIENAPRGIKSPSDFDESGLIELAKAFHGENTGEGLDAVDQAEEVRSTELPSGLLTEFGLFGKQEDGTYLYTRQPCFTNVPSA